MDLEDKETKFEICFSTLQISIYTQNTRRGTPSSCSFLAPSHLSWKLIFSVKMKMTLEAH